MNKKSLIIYITIILILAITIVLAIVFFKPKQNSNKSAQNQAEQTIEPSNNIYELTNEQEKSIFNSHFDIYSGDYTKGSKVKMLLSVINSVNDSGESHKVEAIINGEQTTNADNITSSNTYNVTMEYANDGYINKVIIEEN